MNPRHLTIIIWKSVSSLFNIVWWLVFTIRGAFGPNNPNLVRLNRLEYFLDFMFLVEIIMTFFIGIPFDEASYLAKQSSDSVRPYNYNMKDIALKYLNSTLVFDLFSLIPTTMFMIQYSSLYYLKGIRIAKQIKNMYDIEEIEKWLKERYSTTKIPKSV